MTLYGDAAGIMAQADKDWERSVRHLRTALAVVRADRVPAGQAVSLYWLGHASQAGIPAHENVRPDPVRCYEEALELFTDLGNAMGANWCRVSLGTCAFFAGDLDRAEQLANQVVDDCLATGIRHPLGQAWGNLADIARRRGDETTTLALLRDAADVYRDHGDPWSLATTLTDLAAQQARMGLDEALPDLAESVRLAEEIGTLAQRQLALAVAAYIHLASGRRAMAIAALGAYDATGHTLTAWGARRSVVSEHADWLRQTLQDTRAALDPVAVATAAASARQRPLEAVIDELILQPASMPITGPGHQAPEP